jgi:menaquinol-cytochrome c reductase cytochrome b/c subunit
MATNGNSNPLERTSDMEGLSAADRARIYKERAAAAGIGRPPSAEQPAAAAPAPAPPAASPAPAAAAQPAAARPAASSLSPEQRERLAAAVQRGSTQAATTPSPVAEQQGRLVYVWPHLLTIELMAAVLMLLSMVVVSVILQAPLEGHANADKTPNPSKAPWYFLNLQELLLHMHPALAGVLVPSGALALIAIIPYFDRDTRDVGRWFGTPKAVRITWFTTWFTAAVLTLLILFDEFIGVKPMMKALSERYQLPFLNSQFMVDIGVPMLLMNGPIVLLLLILGLAHSGEDCAARQGRRLLLGIVALLGGIGLLVANILGGTLPILLLLQDLLAAALIVVGLYLIFAHPAWHFAPKPEGVRDWMICLFTGFFVVYIVLTIFGTFFRGQGMHLYWPWDPRQIRIE